MYLYSSTIASEGERMFATLRNKGKSFRIGYTRFATHESIKKRKRFRQRTTQSCQHIQVSPTHSHANLQVKAYLQDPKSGTFGQTSPVPGHHRLQRLHLP
ncbi:hypothetical protein M413DRAFT_80777 [Hebeloma cylindrosporum]|uniref:Uncharacterized protein n=1 Tax=Hebeloma cylindrosporum TaxID=76867 RepID=A0A0C3CII3_HEBCY|nr:hypothetical protein M413DRAFT_80777 [Hebeloma cylindrosporum h7]